MNINSNYYIRKRSGGYSPCKLGNDKYGLRPSEGSVLPNCVGFVVGYVNERRKLNACKLLGSWKPSYFITGAKKQEMHTGSSPKAGAVAVWAEHVAIVESFTKTRLNTIESGWSYTKAPIVREVSRKISDIKDLYGGFKGYIYIDYPDEKDNFVTYTVKAGDTLTKIAHTYNTTIAQIMSDNKIIKNRNLIKVGWKLSIRR